MNQFIDSFLQPASPISSLAWLLWAIAVFCIPYQLYYNYTINAFYHYGAPYADSGLFAHLLWRNDWVLTNPHYRGDFSYFGVHYTPIFLLLTRLSYILSTNMHEFFAGWTSALFSTLGVTIFFTFRFFLKPQTQWHMLFLALLAIGVSLNAVVTHNIWLPHFEYAIPLGIFAFLFFYRSNMGLYAALSYIFILTLREDAGLHLAAVMGLLILAKFNQTRQWRPLIQEASITLVAIIYSVVALWAVGHIAASAGAAKVMSFIYIGDPPFSHVTFELLWTRLGHFLQQHMAICIAMVVTAIWSWRTRNIYMMIGFAANIPWLLVNLVAINDNTGHLYAYYAFPLFLGFVWPFIGNMWRHGAPLSKDVLRESFIFQIVLIFIGLFSWDQGIRVAAYADARWGSYIIQKGTDNKELMKDFIANFNEGGGNYGRVIVDFTVLALVNERYRGEYVQTVETAVKGDTVMYMSPFSTEPNNFVKGIIMQNNLMNKMCLVGTTLCMYTNRSTEQIRSAYPHFIPK